MLYLLYHSCVASVYYCVLYLFYHSCVASVHYSVLFLSVMVDLLQTFSLTFFNLENKNNKKAYFLNPDLPLFLEACCVIRSMECFKEP